MLIQEFRVTENFQIRHSLGAIAVFGLPSRYWDTESVGWWRVLRVELSGYGSWIMIRDELVPAEPEDFSGFVAMAAVETRDRLKGRSVRASQFVGLFSCRLVEILQEWIELGGSDGEAAETEAEKNFGAAISDPGTEVEASSSGREFWYEGDV